MKKMRKFAWMFMAAMTVAGFSACSNSEDEDLPGTGVTVAMVETLVLRRLL